MIKRAYSLTEMAIVILIISILATGALSVYFNLDSGVKVHENERKLKVIYASLGVYLHKNASLPCPAAINVARSLETTFGVASVTANCQGSGVYLGTGTGATNLTYGMIPVQDLNLDLDYALDSYGNKFTYIVDNRFTSSATTNGFGSIYPATSIMTINDMAGGQTHKITDDAVFVIVSHGRKGFGAYGENLTSVSASKVPTDSHENENYDVTAFNNTTHVADFDNDFIHESLDNEIFDDVLLFKTRDEMVVDFRAYNKVYCLDSDATNGNQSINYGSSTKTYNWLSTSYNNFVESAEICPDTPAAGSNYQLKNDYPIKRCGILGKWDTVVTVNCKNI